MNERYEIARKIVEMTADFEAGKLKRTARDFISGMLKAYGILVGTSDQEVAYALAKVDALRAVPRDGEPGTRVDDDSVGFVERAGEPRFRLVD